MRSTGLFFDVDRTGAAIDWSDRNCPAPNITVKNPRNGHAHLLYALTLPVRTAPDASASALKYAAAIERALCEKLGADVNYSGLICKNPFHQEWQVVEWRLELYTLDELADYLDLSASARRRVDKDYGMGAKLVSVRKRAVNGLTGRFVRVGQHSHSGLMRDSACRNVQRIASRSAFTG